MSDEELLQRYGWTVECLSPFEIRHEDGSFATGQAASIVLLYVNTVDDDAKFWNGTAENFDNVVDLPLLEDETWDQE